MKVVFMFPGQGSQYRQMGSELLGNNPIFRNSMLEFDEIYKSIKGTSIISELYDSKYRVSDVFAELTKTHPAIFMVEFSLYKVLQNEGINPDCVVGFSLGEFVAATVSGLISKEDAFELTIKQADFIEKNCPKGGLIAVLEGLEAIRPNEFLPEGCSIGAINGDSQFLIAGELHQLLRARTLLKQKGIIYNDMNVLYGFHSSAIDAAYFDFSSELQHYAFKEPDIPLVSGCTSDRIVNTYSDHFWNVVRLPFDFKKTIKGIELMFDIGENLTFIDVGPSGSLANLIKYSTIDKTRSKYFQILTPFHQGEKNFDEVKKFFRGKKDLTNASFKCEQELTAYVFPGQGSQRRGMGEDLFDLYPDITHQADKILGYSVKELCLSDPEKKLNKTEYTQPALYLVNYLYYLKLKDETGRLPNFLAGHSLGEYNALLAAGCIDFETGLKLVQKRGFLMSNMKNGGMAAVKGLSKEKVLSILRANALEDIEIANYNTSNQIVLSGNKTDIEDSGKLFESAGATLYFPLNVSGAFHSSFMQPIKDEFEDFINGFNFTSLKIPVISNVSSSPYTAESIKELLTSQLVNPVRWTDSISYLLEKGVKNFKEVGPGDVLTKMIWSISKQES